MEGGFGAHFRAHARGLSAVAIASALGVLASFAFQVVSARYLAPAAFGLLSSFLVVVSTAAIGSSALQNIIAVQTSSTISHPGAEQSTRRFPWEALAIGGIGGLAVAVLSPVIAESLSTTPAVVLAAATCIPLSFVFADALGLLQGAGDVSRAVWWSTASLIVRVVLLIAAIGLGAGVAGVIGSVVAATAVSVGGAVWSARRIRRPAKGALSMDGLAILVLTASFAWLTMSDVIFVRAGTTEAFAGTYASATVLVKAGFLVPSTLSLYLLPRFVRNRDNPRLARVGVAATLGISLATGIVMSVLFALLGAWLISFLFGDAYGPAVALLVPVSLAYIPWIAAQGMLIKMTSSASKAAAGVLIVAVAAQWIAFTAVLPDIQLMLFWLAGIGVSVLAAFLLIDALHMRRVTAAERTDS